MPPFFCVVIFISTLQGFSTDLSAAVADPTATCNTDYVPEGTSLNCTCTDSSSGSSANLSWPGHSNTAVLTVDSVRRDDNGTVFTCLVEGQGVTDRTTNVTLLVAYGPTDNTINITSSPSVVTSETPSVTLTCTARDVYPSVTYSWSGLCSSNTATCTFTPRAQDDGNYSHCHAINSVFTSTGVVIEGFASYQLFIAYGPTDNTITITSSPRYVTSETTSVTLTCTARDVYPSVTYSWSGLCSSNTATCTFTPRAQDDGNYSHCHTINSVFTSTGVVIEGFASYQLQIAYGPTDETITITSSPSVVTSETPSVTLTCTARDVYPSVTYSWSGLCSSNTATCTFTPRAQDDGNYSHCHAINSVFTSTGVVIEGFASYQLLIAYGPTDDTVSITSSPSVVTSETPSVTLTCSARDVYPSVTYSWSGLCSSNTATCTFTPRAQDDGNYSHCHAINSVFTSTGVILEGFASYQLQFPYGPSDNTINITSSPRYVTSETPSVTLTCSARDVYPSVTYSWSGLCSSNTATCTFTPRAQDDGNYSHCHAINSVFTSTGVVIEGFASYQLNIAPTAQSTISPNSLAGKANIDGLFILVCLFATTAAVNHLNSHL